MRVLRDSEKFIVYTPLGPALCWAVTDDATVERFMIFHTWQLETKEPWSWTNPDVRIAGSNSGRRDDIHSSIYLTPERVEFLAPHIRRHKASPFYTKID